MNLQNSRKLSALFDAGYVIQIEAGPYVTGNVTDISQEDSDTDEPGQYVYSDEHMGDRPLSEVFPDEIKVLVPIDWLNHEVWEIIINPTFGSVDEIDIELFKTNEN